MLTLPPTITEKGENHRMSHYIAQIGIPIRQTSILQADQAVSVDYFDPFERSILPEKAIYPLGELAERYQEHPYQAICIAIPHLPETQKDELSPEYRRAVAIAVAFAETKGIPFYFDLPQDKSPAGLAAKIKEDEQQNAFLQAHVIAYQVISNSFFWKITRPLRALTDIGKRVGRKIPPLHKLAKGLRYCKQYGIRATWNKLRKRRVEIKHVKKELYTEAELEAQRQHIFERDIKFSILVPLYNTPIPFLKEMIASVSAQTYANWELCLADGSDAAHEQVEHEVALLAKEDARIRYQRLEKNLGISENTNACIDMATGDYIALFDHDDILHPAALFNMMEAICEQDADFVYTDEAIFQSPNVKHIIRVNYKPDYAPDTLRAVNYICHFTAFKRELCDKVGRFRKEFDGSQDHDLILRLTEQAKHIVHIPKVLYFWRAHKQSVAMSTGAKSYAADAGKRAVLAAMTRTGQTGEVESCRALASMYRVRYELTTDEPVSIIIPNKNHLKDLKCCLDSIFKKTTYPNYEIVIVDNGSDEPALFAYYEELKKDPRVKICSLDIPFNYSKLNNYAISHASGAYYLLLNNDIEIITPEWIEEMLMYVQREDVGAAGAMLYYPDDTVQHAGVIIGIGGIAGHAFKFAPRNELGYMGRLCYAQNLSAVTAACMLVKASVYHAVGGLDEGFQVAFNDIDLCMKIRQAGYLIVWTPHAEAIHYESKSRGYEDTVEKQLRFRSEILQFEHKWGEQLAAGDPYYNPNLTLEREDFSTAD